MQRNAGRTRSPAPIESAKYHGLPPGPARRRQIRLRPACGLLSPPGPTFQVFNTAIQVILEFAIQIAFHAVAPKAEEIEKPSHRLFPLMENQPDRGSQAVPTLFLDHQLLLARSRQRIELCFATGFRFTPLRFQPAFLFKPVQRRVEGSLVDLHSLARHLLKPLREAVAMSRFQRQNLKNQHVKRALRNGKAGGRHVASTFDIYIHYAADLCRRSR